MCKRILIFIIAALMLAACASCSGSTAGQPAPTGAGADDASDEPSPSPSSAQTEPAPESRFYVVDFDPGSSSEGMQPIFETDDSIYYVCEENTEEYGPVSIMYFSDKEQKDWMPLCGRPNCLHNDPNCNAWLEGRAGMKVWLYGEHFYYVVQSNPRELWRARLDGTDHEMLLEMRLPELPDEWSVVWYRVFHNKYILTLIELISAEGRETYAYLLDLSAPVLEEKTFDMTADTGEKLNYITPLFGKGDLLYVTGRGVDDGKTVFCVDLAEERISKLCTLPFAPGTCSYSEGGLLYFADCWNEGLIFSVDVNNGEIKTVCDVEPKTRRWFYEYNGHIYGAYTSDNDSLKGTEVCDYLGNLIVEIPYESYDRDITIYRILGNYVFGYDISDEIKDVYSTPPEWYLDIRDIGTDNLMWRRWEPEG